MKVSIFDYIISFYENLYDFKENNLTFIDL